jgi:prepilin peptidase CpaA
VNVGLSGWTGLGQSLGGIALAIAIVGGLCWLRTMGFGDLKLCAAAGAWIGPSSLLFALAITAMVGGILAIIYAVWKGKLGLALERTVNLSRRPHANRIDVSHPEALTIPYAPAIAAGVVFSFFAV